MAEPSTYKSLDIFTASKKLVVACYALTHDFPAEEKNNLTYFIRNAALKAHFAISKGIFLRNGKRKLRLLQRARDAFVVIDAAVDVLVEVGLAPNEQVKEVLQLSSVCFQQLDSLLTKNES